MSNKYTKQIPGLLLDSQIHNDFISVPPLIIKSTKSLNPCLQNQKINSPLHKKYIEHKSQQQIATSDQSFFSKYIPNHLKIQRQISTNTSIESFEQMRIQQQRKILQRNFGHQLQYYIRLRIKDLSTVIDMLTANQYQRLFKYAETQLTMWKKIHEEFLREDNVFNAFKGTASRDTYLKSNILSINEDLTYKQMINNIITSLQQNEKNVSILPSTIQKLNTEIDLTVKKLANYLQQTPFLVKSSQASTNLATRFIKELRYSDGHQILQLLSKSVKQISKGKYMIPIEQPQAKSQMSKLIEQHSINKIKKKKSLS